MRCTRSALALVICAAARFALADQAVTFLGSTSIPGTARDKSGLTGMVPTNEGKPSDIPNDAFGSAGSAIDYTGADNLYLMASDRGPSNGDVRYACRVHAVRITLGPGAAASHPLHAEVAGTTLLTSPAGRNFTGSAAAFVGAPGFAEPESLRLDPEAIRMSHDHDGSFWIADEYGPFVLKFSAQGRQIAAFPVPAKYAAAEPKMNAEAELTVNKIGRQPNRGMEGLAITPDGKMLVGIMQSALKQDHGVDASNARISLFTRILTMNLQDQTTHEYVYPFDSAKFGVNEMLAINEHEFLVIERDGKAAAAAKAKHITHIDLAGATDISRPFMAGGRTYDYTGTTADNGLPAEGPIPGVVPAAKTPLFDLLDPAYGLAGAQFPEKIEGLAWGPDFDDGDKLLIITSDNDFLPENATWFYAFRVRLKK